MTPPPEFARPLTLDAARRARTPIEISAADAERTALAQRFDLVALHSLSAVLSLRVNGDIIDVTGTVDADVEQSCVATAAAVPAHIDAPVAIRLVPAGQLEAAEAEAEIELAGDDLEVVDYDGAAIDLGEIAAQTMALALDPWPRSPDAEAVLRAAGVKSEEEAGAFGALAALRDTLNR